VLRESTELIKVLALVGAFASTSVLVYVLLRERAVRLAVRTSLEDPRLSHPSLTDTRASAMRGPFAQRVLAPATRKAAGLVYRFGPTNLAEKTRRRLVLAGLDVRLDADTFLAISVGGPLVLGAFMIALSRVGGFAPILWLAVPLSGFLPKMWVTRKVEHRQKAIRLALADTLDLLTIAVEAGLGFDAAVSRVVTSIPGPLSDELYRMLQELKIGVPRNQALKNLAERTAIDDLDQFITAVTQADTFGIAVGKILRIQAHQLRQKRSQMAEERAAKTPVKLLFPLILCVFPALFTVLVGPAAIKIVEALFGNI
jgi:tight adherence protein C